MNTLLTSIDEPEEHIVRPQKPKPTADEALAEDLFIPHTHAHAHNMRAIKIKGNEQILRNFSAYEEERKKVKGAVGAPVQAHVRTRTRLRNKYNNNNSSAMPPQKLINR